ncbi:MAG: zinc-binding dehydrogenase [Chloroflexi bacterium]|nr:zinc-binding dehydrogenase [Chloroflexota bacterium]
MKAILLDEHGPSSNLRYDDIDAPEPAPHEVQVNLRAAALNRLDIWVRNGWPGIKLNYPHIPGADGAGIVSAVGRDVSTVGVGQHVAINPLINPDRLDPLFLAGKDNLSRHAGILGEDMRGTYAEYVCVPEWNVLPLPESVSFEEAAAASLVFLTAWHSLVTRGQIQPGETVLIIGAGGGANTAYLQIAKMFRATVYVVGSNAEKCQKAAELGADVTIDRSQEEWGKAVYKLTNKRGVDVVIDNVGQATWPSSLRSVTRGGRMLVVGNSSGYDIQIDSRYIFTRHITIIGSTMGAQTDFRTVMPLLFAGKLRAVIHDVMPLQDAAQAQDRLESGDVFGKLVLAIP